MKNKKHQLVQETPISLSPAEQIPANALSEIFSYLDLTELTGVAPVSKFWNEQTYQDSRWHELYIKKHSELYRLFYNKIPSAMFKKKYFESERIMREIKAITANKLNKSLKNELQAALDEPTDVGKQKAKEIVKIFKKAIKKNSFETVHVLLNANFLNIHGTVRFTSWKAHVCFASPLVHYAALNGSLEMVKLLLLHGANVTKKVRWNRTNSSYESNILDDLSIGSKSKKSLICIGYAEHFLSVDDVNNAIKSFEKSDGYDSKVMNDYIRQVQEDNIGFNFQYNESLIEKLNICFKSILDKPNINRCIIS